MVVSPRFGFRSRINGSKRTAPGCLRDEPGAAAGPERPAAPRPARPRPRRPVPVRGDHQVVTSSPVMDMRVTPWASTSTHMVLSHSVGHTPTAGREEQTHPGSCPSRTASHTARSPS